MVSGFCIRYTFSKPTLIRCPQRRISRMITVGSSSGRSMCQMRRSLVAPSTIADSCRPGSMADSAARKMIEPHPTFCQIPENT